MQTGVEQIKNKKNKVYIEIDRRKMSYRRQKIEMAIREKARLTDSNSDHGASPHLAQVKQKRAREKKTQGRVDYGRMMGSHSL